MLGIGLSVAGVGVILLLTTRLRFFRSFMTVRRQLIQQATAAGDTDRATKLSHELHVYEARLPKYALWFIYAGLATTLICAILLFHGTRTI